MGWDGDFSCMYVKLIFWMFCAEILFCLDLLGLWSDIELDVV